MKIVIPMSGTGSRFQKAGYETIKPLIEVNGKPFIEWVCNLFPGEDDFIFICRDEHLRETNLREVLNKIRPTGKIVEVEGHKFGPVYAVSKVYDLLEDDEPVIVNYCDFYMHWDYADFKRMVAANQCAGAIPSYTGFHPHLMHEHNVYATTLVDEQLYASEIKEKHHYNQDKTKDYHSGGTYYFSKGTYVKKYFQELMDRKMALNGEYYVSMVYELLIENQLPVWVYDKVPHFCQWGTPSDLEEFLYWMSIFNYKKQIESAIELSE